MSETVPRGGDPADARVEASIGYVLRLGRALHAAGTPAPRLEEVLDDASERLGLEGQFFTTPTSIFAAFGPIEQQRAHLIRVEPGSFNLGQLADIDRVARDVQGGRLSVAQASTKVEAVIAGGQRYHWVLLVIAAGLTSAVGCRFLGGGRAEIEAAALVGLAVGVMGLGFRHLTIPSYLFELATAFLASLIVTTLVASGFRCAVATTTLAGIIVALPGLSLTLAITELASRHLAAGTARLSSAFVVFLALIVGVALAATIVTSIAGPIETVPVVPLPEWTLYAALALAPLVFSLLLGARMRDLPWIYVASVLGFLGMRAGQVALGPELGAAVGGFAVGLISNAYDRGRFGPSTLLLAPGVLLLVPGSIGFQSMTALLDEEIVAGVDTAFTMMLTAVSLAAGLLVANVVIPLRKARWVGSERARHDA